MWSGRFTFDRVFAVVAVGSLVPAWAMAQAPDMFPGGLTIGQAAAPTATHVLLLVVTAIVVFLVVPSLGLLLYLDQRSHLEPTKH